MTHSLKVGQVARKIGATVLWHCEQEDEVARACRRFGGANDHDKSEQAPPVDVWALEAAGMAHDLGHPPFGHIAEQALQQLLGDDPNKVHGKGPHRASLVAPEIPGGYHLPDSFEGNAQSFRVVTRLSFGRYAADESSEVGLNLSKATLSAMQKYPWLHSRRPTGVDAVKMKWGAYNSEQDLLEWAMEGVNTEPRIRVDGRHEYRTVEAQAMDWADDITYAVHDLEDFYRAGLIPVDELASSMHSRAAISFWRYCKEKLEKNASVMAAMEHADFDLDTAFKSTQGFLFQAQGATNPGRTGRANLRKWAAGTIDGWTDPSVLKVAPATGAIELDPAVVVQVEILKQLTWFFVIDRPALASAQLGQQRLIRELFVWLSSWVDSAYEGPELPIKNSDRKNYVIGGLPDRLIDYLDISWWQGPDEGGYADERKKIARAVVDYIVSLTETQAIELHSRLAGISVRSTLEGWFAV